MGTATRRSAASPPPSDAPSNRLIALSTERDLGTGETNLRPKGSDVPICQKPFAPEQIARAMFGETRLVWCPAGRRDACFLTGILEREATCQVRQNLQSHEGD